MALKYIWNEEKTRSIRISQIKEFYIIASHGNKYYVRASLSKDESILITICLSKAEAEEFIEKLIAEME